LSFLAVPDIIGFLFVCDCCIPLAGLNRSLITAIWFSPVVLLKYGKDIGVGWLDLEMSLYCISWLSVDDSNCISTWRNIKLNWVGCYPDRRYIIKISVFFVRVRINLDFGPPGNWTCDWVTIPLIDYHYTRIASLMEKYIFE
jgi:hypothetical protein